METSFHDVKRKKRKTRKCLDELRKRSRSNSVKHYIARPNILKTKAPAVIINDNSKINKNCITSKRLTLNNMFAKAVRSETITRPLFCDSKQDHDLIINTRSLVTSPINILVESKSSDASANLSNETVTFERQSDYAEPYKREDSSSESIVCFSPRQQEDKNGFPESDNEDSMSTVTSTSRSNEDFGYNLCKLHEDITLYAKRNLSDFIKMDVMKNTRTCLENLRMKRLPQNLENNQVGVIPDNCYTNIGTSDRLCTTPNKTIVQNPMDYIKIGWTQDLSHSEATTPSCGASPVRSPPLYSPPARIQGGYLPSIISFTPDYDFYPHRLNE